MTTRGQIIAILAAILALNIAHANEVTQPLLVIYADGFLPVENVTVAVTNPHKDRGILIRSVEFEDQMPELRYFYHGIYGSISKKGSTYEHYAESQQLSIPVGSCFLLPGQSASWSRPMRLVDGEYMAHVIWSEIPKKKIPTSIWFQTNKSNGFERYIYEALSETNEVFYSNTAAAEKAPRYVILEGDPSQLTATTKVACVNKQCGGIRARQTTDGFPEGSIQFSLNPISEHVVISSNKVFFQKYNMKIKAYETVLTPSISVIAMDFLFQCARSDKKTVPCILAKKDFDDIADVREPSTDMYFNPGITLVPINLFPQILSRAHDRNCFVNLACIDPNSLGKQYVITIGLPVAANGRQKETVQPAAGDYRLEDKAKSQR